MYRDVARDRGLQCIDHYAVWIKVQKEDPAKFAAYLPDGLHQSLLGAKEIIVPGILKALGLE